MKRTLSLASLAVCTSFALAAQSFEVASIKLHADPVRTVGISISGVRVTVSAMSLSNLVEYGYNLKLYQVSGGPVWATSDRWDIAAKGDGDNVLTTDQVRKMLQALLIDRFQLKLHRELKERPVYALAVSAKGGSKLKESAPDASPNLRMGGGNRTILITTTKGGMEQLAAQLSGNLDRPVLDKTNLTGTYDYRLEWAPDNPAANPDAPSIFAALQEQLGLKLESAKAAIETVIIDHAAKPSAN